MIKTELFTNKRAAIITETTPRQVQDWTEKGLVYFRNHKDIRSGRSRVYDFENLIELRLVRELFNAGLSLAAVGSILNKSRGQLIWMDTDSPWLIKQTELCSHLVNLDRIIWLVANRMEEMEEKGAK